MNCNEAVAALIASLENGTAMSEEQRAHIATCERCHGLLDSAKQFQTLLAGNGIEPPPLEPAMNAAEEEVRRSRLRRAVRVAFGAAIIVGAATLLMLLSWRREHFDFGQAAILTGAGIMVALLVSIPVLLVLAIVRPSDPRKRRFYKRLGSGRALSGVCRGLSEASGIDVQLIRLAFFLALFFHGLGFWLYLLLDLTMPPHPDDRQHLLRFRLRRWFARRRTSNA